jgi:hypothetical protein
MRAYPLLIAVVVSGAFAQAPSQPDEKTEAARAVQAAAIAKKAVASYRVTSGGTRGKVLQLEPESLLQWSNPAGGSFHGSVFVWTAEGRPEVVASIHKKFLPLPHELGVEFLSLGEGPASAERDGHADWSAARGGVEFRPVPGAPRPADTPARRLRQVRAIAAEFSASKTDRKGIVRQLRLLTKPVFGYEGADPDGALFAFVEGTDPEVFLFVEARKGAAGLEWQYALAPMGCWAVKVKLKGRATWELPRRSTGDPSKPLFTYQFWP